MITLLYMKDSYEFGPIAISKSFIKQPLFLPGVIATIIIVLVFVMVATGRFSFSNPPPVPTLKAQIFPLNQSLSKSILYSVGTTIYRTNGQSEEKLFEVGSQVLSLVPSNNNSLLAATYKNPNGGSNAAGYPYSSLIFWDMKTGRSLPIFAEQNATVRYPEWSDDSRYLTFWTNDGDESFVYDTTIRRPIYSVKRENSSAVSPIVFIPGASEIAYIKNGTVYTAAVDGSRPIMMAEQAVSVRTVNGTTIASAPVVSPTGLYLAYYTASGDLSIVNMMTRETKTVGSQINNLGFISNDEIVYTTIPQDSNQTPEFFHFSMTDGKSVKINNGKGFLSHGAWPQAAILLPAKGLMILPSVYPNVGPQIFDKDGVMQKDCSMGEFQYQYNNSSNDTSFPQSLTIASPDGKYLLGTSEHSQAVIDTSTCQPYIITQSQPTVSTWMP